MEKKKRIITLAVILMIISVNYFRLKGNENIRPVQYISLLIMGALGGLLLKEIITLFRAGKQ